MKLLVSGEDIKGCLVILILAFCIGFGVNFVSPKGIPLLGQWDREAGVIMAGSTREGEAHASEINNPLKVKLLLETGDIALLDVRRADVYDQGHLPGALSFPLSEFDQVIDRLKETISPQAAVLLYCSGVTCHDSHAFGARLLKMGFAHVSVYAGGFSEWEEMGFDVEAGSGN